MASRLYRLGRLSFRRRRLVASLWVALLLVMGGAAGALSGPYSDEFSIPGTESQDALDVLADRFPQSGLAQATANVVFAAPEGRSLQEPELQAAVASVLAEVAAADDVAVVSDPFTTQAVSPDGRIARSTVTYALEPLAVTEEDREVLFETAEVGREAGLEVEFSGVATAEVEQGGGAGELVGVAAAAVVLLVMFGSVVAAGLPLLTALIGVGIGMAGITSLTGFVELSSTAPILALMLGLAVGIDYALFITSRYRHELLSGREGEEAAGRAVATAGSGGIL